MDTIWTPKESGVYVIAEAGVNHNGSSEMAFQLIDVATEAGADAVKFQTFKAERLASPTAPKADYQLQTTDGEESQFDMLKRLELQPETYEGLIVYCRERNIDFLSTPFDEDSADFLLGLGMEAFKIPSGEITNLPFLKHVAAFGKPMIVSTGMSNLEEVAIAVDAIKETGNTQLVLLHCTTNYPTDPVDVNLRAMESMRHATSVPVGYSDHTEGIAVGIAAAALQASIVEKHFTLDRSLPGPDHKASLEPEDLAAMIKGIRIVETALGDGEKRPTKSEASSLKVIRKSLVAAKPLRAHTIITTDCIAIVRPGTGLPPTMRDRILGRSLKRDVQAGELLLLEMMA